MKRKTEIDEKGRITIPEHIREKENLSEGDTLLLSEHEETILLKPQEEETELEEPEYGYYAEPYHEEVKKTLWDVPEMQCMFKSQDNANLATLLLEIRDNQEKILEKLEEKND